MLSCGSCRLPELEGAIPHQGVHDRVELLARLRIGEDPPSQRGTVQGLVETGQADQMDLVLVIEAPRAQRIRRMVEDRGMRTPGRTENAELTWGFVHVTQSSSATMRPLRPRARPSSLLVSTHGRPPHSSPTTSADAAAHASRPWTLSCSTDSTTLRVFAPIHFHSRPTTALTPGRTENAELTWGFVHVTQSSSATRSRPRAHSASGAWSRTGG
jgi:hypothetical protein